MSRWQIYEVVTDADGVDCYIKRGEIIRCRECKHYHVEKYHTYCDFLNIRGVFPPDPHPDGYCSYGERNADPNTLNTLDALDDNCSEKPNNSTISKMEQVETMSCAECKHRPIGAEICEEPCHYEPQTDWHYDEQDATWYPYKHEDEPQQESCATCKHALGNWDGESNNCGRCCGADRRFYEPIEDEPQTERSSE